MKHWLSIGGLILVTVIWGGGFVASDMALESMELIDNNIPIFKEDGTGGNKSGNIDGNRTFCRIFSADYWSSIYHTF